MCKVVPLLMNVLSVSREYLAERKDGTGSRNVLVPSWKGVVEPVVLYSSDSLALSDLMPHQACIVTIAHKQFVVRPLFHDAALVQYQDQVSVANSAQAMRNDDLCAG